MDYDTVSPPTLTSKMVKFMVDKYSATHHNSTTFKLHNSKCNSKQCNTLVEKFKTILDKNSHSQVCTRNNRLTKTKTATEMIYKNCRMLQRQTLRKTRIKIQSRIDSFCYEKWFFLRLIYVIIFISLMICKQLLN